MAEPIRILDELELGLEALEAVQGVSAEHSAVAVLVPERVPAERWAVVEEPHQGHLAEPLARWAQARERGLSSRAQLQIGLVERGRQAVQRLPQPELRRRSHPLDSEVVAQRCRSLLVSRASLRKARRRAS